MDHPPFPKGATPEEVRLDQQIHQVGSQQRDSLVRPTFSDALEMLVELIKERGRRREFDRQVDDGKSED